MFYKRNKHTQNWSKENVTKIYNLTKFLSKYRIRNKTVEEKIVIHQSFWLLLETGVKAINC